MKKSATLVIAMLALAVSATEVDAGSWVFRQSYHSHQASPAAGGVAPGGYALPGQIPFQGYAARQYYPQPGYAQPRYTQPGGAYLRGGFRHLRVGGNLRNYDDHHHFFESWIQHGGQF